MIQVSLDTSFLISFANPGLQPLCCGKPVRAKTNSHSSRQCQKAISISLSAVRRMTFIVRSRLPMIAILLTLLTSGCATNALWNNTKLDDCNEPAVNSRLQLYDASRRKDFLVVYDEYSERHDSTRTRAYFLNQNEKRIEQGRKPYFVSVQLSRELSPIPAGQTLHASTTHFSPAVYAVVSTNTQSFTVYSSEHKTNYDLPVYNDGWGRIDRIALTPVAVVADLTIIGGYLGCAWIYGLALI